MSRKTITDWNKFRDQFVRWTLRRASFRWPPRGEAMKVARVERGLYKCALCTKLYKVKEVKVDHIEPVVSVQDMSKELTHVEHMGWYVLRMFPEASGFQVLCNGCHDDKTRGENYARREHHKQIKTREGNSGSKG